MNSEISFRPYDSKRDMKAVIRIWKECGWLDMKKDRKKREAFSRWLAAGTADVAEFRGEAECLASIHRGTIEMLGSHLPFAAVSSVTAGRVLRRMGGTGELTARAIARAAEEGCAVAGLGIFDQGFYDRLGFGTFPYIRHIHFDPLALKVPPLSRPPVRLTKKDLPRMTVNITERMGNHGQVNLPVEAFHGFFFAEVDNGFGLGFEDANGRLTHHMWVEAKGESGPYRILWTAYRSYTEFMELMSLVKNLGDQVYKFIIREPVGIQFQDMLDRPLRTRDMTEDSKFGTKVETAAYKQARILDMDAVLGALRVPGKETAFNLDLDDPITEKLPGDSQWKGVGGEWTVRLGEKKSSAEKGHSPELPLVKASVNAFTRLVFGVATPSGLAATDHLEAPVKLLAELDDRLRLPEPDMVQLF